MVFSSTVFVFLYLPAVLTFYFLIPKRLRNLWLLAFSLLFYAWGEPVLVLVMLFSSGIDYVAGFIIGGGLSKKWPEPVEPLSKGGPRTLLQKGVLALSLTSNLCILGFFKYFNFGVDNFNALVGGLGLTSWQWHTAIRVTLPLGVSFYTFQSMSYPIDVYLGNTRATRNYLDFVTFVTLFPQLVAGPIVRYVQVANELVDRHITLERFALGVRRFTVGLGKKLLIANTVAVGADQVFALPGNQLTPGIAWVGLVCYTLQIYYDFSGYSDMAIGMGHMLGFYFPENFRYPYASQSMTDFWRRWHITLSTWFRDYLYIPLGGSRKGPLRTYFNLVLVFFLCGLWHGASWSFVVWGLFHGFFLVVERLVRNWKSSSYWTPLRHVYVLLVAMVSWVLFRTDTLPEAITYLKAMAGFALGKGELYYAGMYINNEILLAMIVGAIGSAPVLPALAAWIGNVIDSRNGAMARFFEGVYLAARMAAVACVFFLCAVQLSSSTHNPFIYFRF